MKLLYSRDSIACKVRNLGLEIGRDIENPVFLGVLNGAAPFAVDLARATVSNLELGFIHAESYEGTKRGKVAVKSQPTVDIENKNVVLVEDIIDSGETVKTLLTYLTIFKPKSISVCSLLKREANPVSVFSTYYAFGISSDSFVVGYGMDLNGQFRHLSDIWTLEEEEREYSNIGDIRSDNPGGGSISRTVRYIRAYGGM